MREKMEKTTFLVGGLFIYKLYPGYYLGIVLDYLLRSLRVSSFFFLEG
jgi:hypothetical protein